MKTTMVIGGAGFIGANFVHRALAQSGAAIVVLDKLTYAGDIGNLPQSSKEPRFSFVQGDLTDAVALREVIARFCPERIINFAAESHVDRSIDGPRSFLETNVCGVFELLEAVRAYFETLPATARAEFRLLQVSTDEVFGSIPHGRRSAETDAYAPNSPYAASKAAADHFVRAYHETYGLPVIITNCTNNYGPRQFPEKLIPLALSKALAGEPIPIYGDGANVRDWIYVDDHCDALMLVLQHGRPGARYNIGGGSERTNLELIGALCEALEELAPAARNPAMSRRGISNYIDLITMVPDRPGHDRRYALDCHLIEQELGWRPRVSLHEGLRATIEWRLAQGSSATSMAGAYRGERLGLLRDPL